MTASLRPFLGPWTPAAPSEDRPGLAEIILLDQPQGAPARLILHSQWRDAEQRRFRQRIACTLDGDPCPLQQDDAWSLSVTFTDQRLTTELRHKDGAVLRTDRHLLSDGSLRVVSTTLPDRDSSSATWVSAQVKQVLLYRRDLKMRKGKIAAQCAHAALSVFLRQDAGDADHMDIQLDGPMAWWMRRSMAKIVLSIDDEDALATVYEQARTRGLPTTIITDAGRTEFHGQPTRTVVAVGPALAHEIDEITGPQGLVSTRLA